MNILHIASVKNDLYSGVSVVVPQHIKAQQTIENIAIINITNIDVAGAEQQFEYKKPFDIATLSEPFCHPDLVVFHEIYRFDYIAISKHLRKKKIPYIIIPHGSLTKEAQRKKRLKKIAGNFVFFNAFINGAAAIQYLSEKEMANSPFGKVKFVGTNGIPIPNNKKESFSEGKVRFLYIGRMDMYHKGLDLMLEAAEKNISFMRENNAEIFMFGPETQGMREQVNQRIEEKKLFNLVSLQDAVTGDEKQEQLLNSDIFVQTSRFEGIPMGILEALSYGLPCVVTEGTNVGEIVKKYDAGWVAQTNADSISDTIKQAIIEQDLWREKSVNAVKLIEDNFMWDKVAADALLHYRKIANCQMDII